MSGELESKYIGNRRMSRPHGGRTTVREVVMKRMWGAGNKRNEEASGTWKDTFLGGREGQ